MKISHIESKVPKGYPKCSQAIFTKQNRGFFDCIFVILIEKSFKDT